MKRGKILELFEDQTRYQPKDRLVPTAKVDDQGKLLIGPSLIGKNHRILWELLATYEDQEPQCRVESALIDVRLRAPGLGPADYGTRAVWAGLVSAFIVYILHRVERATAKTAHWHGFDKQFASWFLHDDEAWVAWLVLSLLLMGVYVLLFRKDSEADLE